jgi:hypothetical protein
MPRRRPAGMFPGEQANFFGERERMADVENKQAESRKDE